MKQLSNEIVCNKVLTIKLDILQCANCTVQITKYSEKSERVVRIRIDVKNGICKKERRKGNVFSDGRCHVIHTWKTSEQARSRRALCTGAGTMGGLESSGVA